MRHEEANFTTDTYKNSVIPTGDISDGHTCIEHAYKVRESTIEEVMQINYIMTILADRFVVADSKQLFEDLQITYFPK